MTARRKITDEQRRARLAVRHRLATQSRTDDIAAIADAVVALHSTDPATVYLSATARMKHPSIEAVSAALYDDRAVVRHHAMRRTLWVLTPSAARSAHGACTTALAAIQWKRLAQLAEDSGITTDGARWAAKARADTLAAMAKTGPTTARQLGKAVPALTEKLQLAEGKSYAASQGAHTRVLMCLGFDGAIVRTRPTGAWNTSEYTWCVTDQWLPDGEGGFDAIDANEAAAELARRYLDRFGPATVADLQWWAGWTTGTTRKAIAAAGAVEVDTDAGPAWVLDGDTDDADGKPWIAFLPALDPTTMGWKERSWYLGAHGAFGGPLFDRNGNAGPTVWVDGRVVGGWAQRKSGEIAFRLLEDLPATRRKAIEAEAERVRELIGDVRVNVRFPAPIQKELLE